MAKIADRMEKISQSVTEGYKKIEDGVVGGYKKIEDRFTGTVLNEDGSMKTGKVGNAVVSGYKKIENAFVDTFLAKEGESVEEAKARVTANTNARQAKIQADMESREAARKEMIEKNLEASRNAGKPRK